MKWKQEHCFFSDGLVDIFNQPFKITFAETPHAGIILFGCKGYFSAARFESSTLARRAHNPKVVGSNPAPATKYKNPLQSQGILLYAVFIVAWID